MITTYALMHKGIRVADLELNATNGIEEVSTIYDLELNATNGIEEVSTIYDLAHMPIGTLRESSVDIRCVRDWWIKRSIPSTRSGIREFMDVLGINDTAALLSKSFGLSLSDQYWICAKDAPRSWDSINFFENDFSSDVGDILFGKAVKPDNLDLSSPDNTSNGDLKKRWRIIDGERCLVKAGTKPYMQETFNEVVASRIMHALDIDHVDYRLLWDEGVPYSVCNDFVTADLELVSAYYVMQTKFKSNNDSFYDHYVKCCSDLGIDIIPELDRMIVLDYIIANGDRHTNNFGLLRDADTLEWIGPAPIYDSGSSFGFDVLTDDIPMGISDNCKPFAKTFEQSLGLVSSFDWVDVEALKSSLFEAEKIFDSAGKYVDPHRKDALMAFLRSRVERIEKCVDLKLVHG